MGSHPPMATLPVDIHHPYWDTLRHGMSGRRVQHRVVLVRHGESKQNREFVASGTTESGTDGLELTAAGRAQARDVARYLHGCPFDAIEVSPIARAMETADPTVVALDARAHIKYDLRERWFKPTTMVKKSDVGRDWVSDDIELAAPEAWTRVEETAVEFRARVEALKDRWRRAGSVDDRRQTLVFAHSLLISQLLGGDVETGPFFHLANGSITVVDFADDGGMHIHMVNRTAHTCPTGHHTPFSL